MHRYIPGSQHWGEGRTGSANLFFDKNRFALVHDAARRHGKGGAFVAVDASVWSAVTLSNSIRRHLVFLTLLPRDC